MNKFYDGRFFTRTEALIPPAEAIMEAIRKFKCVKAEQLKYMIPQRFTGDISISELCRHLLNKKRIIEQNEVYMSPDMTMIDYEMIDSIWLAISLVKNKENKEEQLRYLLRGTFPVTVGIIVDGKTLYRIIPVSSSTDLEKIIIENDKLREKGENFDGTEAFKTVYLLLLRDFSIVNDVAKYNPQFPLKIALVEGDYNVLPTVKYYDLA